LSPLPSFRSRYSHLVLVVWEGAYSSWGLRKISEAFTDDSCLPPPPSQKPLHPSTSALAMTSQSPEQRVREAYVAASFGQLHYATCAPATDPCATPNTPILRLRMAASSSLSMYALMRKLCTLGYSTFAPDMPGLGGSDDPITDPPDIAWYASLYHTAFSLLLAFVQGCHTVSQRSGAVIGTELVNG
jgi:hypothetical protein